MTDDTNVPAAVAWERSLRTVEGLLKLFDKQLQQELDIPVTWYDVLIHLGMAPDGRLRMQTLADSVALQSTGQTRLIDRIEKAGLVRREPAAEDRRGYYAVLTDKGRQVFERAQVIHRADIERNFTQYLDEDEVQALHTIMNKLWNGNPNLAARRSQK